MNASTLTLYEDRDTKLEMDLTTGEIRETTKGKDDD